MTARHDPDVTRWSAQADHGRQLAARRRAVYGDDGAEGISRLARTFPSLRNAPGVAPWDCDRFFTWAASGVLSHGELLAAQFILGVWNPRQDWDQVAEQKGLLKKMEYFAAFDLFEAMNTWDQAHVDALRQWIELPFFP